MKPRETLNRSYSAALRGAPLGPPCWLNNRGFTQEKGAGEPAAETPTESEQPTDQPSPFTPRTWAELAAQRWGSPENRHLPNIVVDEPAPRSSRPQPAGEWSYLAPGLTAEELRTIALIKASGPP